MQPLPLDPAEEAPPEREPGALARLLARTEVWLRMRMGPAAVALPTIVFVVCWLYLNAFAGSTWPLGESRFPAYLAPSPEATVGLAIVCAIVWIGRKPHAALFFVLAGVLLVARLLATADALVVVALDRPFHPGRDLSLVWELFILLDDTVDRLTLVGWMAASAIVFGMLLFFAKQAFAIARNYFVERTHRLLFAGTAGVLALLSLALGGPYQRSPVAAAFAGPEETEASDVAARAAAVRARVRGAPHGLERLEGRDVYVIHVPSDGRALLDEPAYRSRMQPVWDETAAALAEDGWMVRSHLLDAPARRGMAWLSHATLATGVRVADQPSFDALLAAEPDTLAQLFRDAGHRTVRVLPGAERDRPELELPGFGNRYRAWELGYLGPAYGRVAVPDQFALWRVWEREAEPSDAGVLADVVMCAAEPPYAQHPPYVEDWSSIGTGELYRTLEPVRFQTEWSRLDEASDAMLATLAHELRVVRGYLVDQLPRAGAPPTRRPGRRRSRRAAPEPLAIVVGSHQPPGPLVDDSAGDAVIVHAISRDEDMLAPFAERGFTEGPVPTAPPPYDGMESFMPWLVAAFSEAPAPEGDPRE